MDLSAPGRFEDAIIAAIRAGRPTFHFLRTSWDMTTDRAHLAGVLSISLRQVRAGLYYGRHTVTTLNLVYQWLTEPGTVDLQPLQDF